MRLTGMEGKFLLLYLLNMKFEKSQTQESKDNVVGPLSARSGIAN